MMFLPDDKQTDLLMLLTYRYLDDILNLNNVYFDTMVKVRKRAKIRNRYNQAPHT